jgi:hypothetical protein
MPRCSRRVESRLQLVSERANLVVPLDAHGAIGGKVFLSPRGSGGMPPFRATVKTDLPNDSGMAGRNCDGASGWRERRLIADDAIRSSPRWSPDGTRLAIRLSPAGAQSLVVFALMEMGAGAHAAGRQASCPTTGLTTGH